MPYSIVISGAIRCGRRWTVQWTVDGVFWGFGGFFTVWTRDFNETQNLDFVSRIDPRLRLTFIVSRTSGFWIKRIIGSGFYKDGQDFKKNWGLSQKSLFSNIKHCKNGPKLRHLCRCKEMFCYCLLKENFILFWLYLQMGAAASGEWIRRYMFPHWQKGLVSAEPRHILFGKIKWNEMFETALSKNRTY